jgi:DNA modification methylase
MPEWEIRVGDVRDVLRTMEPESVQCVVTSPPYWGLRDYGTPGQIGLEPTPEEYVAVMVEVFAEVRRVLRKDGTVWLNLGDAYAGGGRGGHSNGIVGTPPQGLGNRYPQSQLGGLKPKDLVGIPWRVAFALQADGWWLRSDIIWAKPNPMPESVSDRPTKAHEYLFLLTKSERYFYDQDAVAERANWPDGSWARSKAYDGDQTGKLRSFYGNGARWTGGETRNLRSVWNIATEPFAEAHFATFPRALVEPCIKAGSRPDDMVLDPFCGSGTAGVVALQFGRGFVGIELSPIYAEMAERRIHNQAGLFSVAGDPTPGSPAPGPSTFSVGAASPATSSKSTYTNVEREGPQQPEPSGRHGVVPAPPAPATSDTSSAKP